MGLQSLLELFVPDLEDLPLILLLSEPALHVLSELRNFVGDLTDLRHRTLLTRMEPWGGSGLEWTVVVKTEVRWPDVRVRLTEALL